MNQIDDDRIWAGLRRHFAAVDATAPARPRLRRPSGRASAWLLASSLTVAAVLLVAGTLGAARLGLIPPGPSAPQTGSSRSGELVMLPAAPAPDDSVARSCQAAGLNGFLRGDEADPRSVWLEANGRRVDLKWPSNFEVRFTSPFEILSAAGQVVAREGESVELGGGFAGDHVFGVCSLNGIAL
jgi:hypothetical protein